MIFKEISSEEFNKLKSRNIAPSQFAEIFELVKQGKIVQITPSQGKTPKGLRETIYTASKKEGMKLTMIIRGNTLTIKLRDEPKTITDTPLRVPF